MVQQGTTSSLLATLFVVKYCIRRLPELHVQLEGFWVARHGENTLDFPSVPRVQAVIEKNFLCPSVDYYTTIVHPPTSNLPLQPSPATARVISASSTQTSVTTQRDAYTRAAYPPPPNSRRGHPLHPSEHLRPEHRVYVFVPRARFRTRPAAGAATISRTTKTP